MLETVRKGDTIFVIVLTFYTSYFYFYQDNKDIKMKELVNHLISLTTTILAYCLFHTEGLAIWLLFFTLLFIFQNKLIYIPRKNILN